MESIAEAMGSKAASTDVMGNCANAATIDAVVSNGATYASDGASSLLVRFRWCFGWHLSIWLGCCDVPFWLVLGVGDAYALSNVASAA